MSARYFEVKPVLEPNSNNPPSQSSETIPLIHIEHEIPQPPPLPISISSINEKKSNQTSSKFFNTILQRKSLDTRRRATIAAAMASIGNPIQKSSSVDIINKIESTSTSSNSTNQVDFIVGNDVDESDVYSTHHSNNSDPNHLSLTNKFLHELRLKRHELREKAKNISIDQRIASNRRETLRAQDIFDVHFEFIDEENNLPLSKPNLFTEESQEKIRNDIYHELDRQRKKQNVKYHRHLMFGRSLLVFTSLLLILMSFTLIYVVIDLYDRANYLDVKLPENEFISMIHDKTTNFFNQIEQQRTSLD